MNETKGIFISINRSIRTNNDIEGWHNRLNRRASGRTQIPLYLLVKLLHSEAVLTSLQARLVSEKKLTRIQRRHYRNLQTKIFGLWERFQNSEINVYQLLKSCAFLAVPAIS